MISAWHFYLTDHLCQEIFWGCKYSSAFITKINYFIIVMHHSNQNIIPIPIVNAIQRTDVGGPSVTYTREHFQVTIWLVCNNLYKDHISNQIGFLDN